MDVLVPAATGGVINKGVAPNIHAKLIVEGANDPTTPEADQILIDRNIEVVPDILANSGGVIASYIEWRQAKSGSLTDKSVTYDVINKQITRAYTDVEKFATEKKISHRISAQSIAVHEVVESMKDRGWI